MKNLENLKGAKALNRKEQQAISGGFPRPQQSKAKLCSSVCPSSNYGTRCDLHAGCPGANDGMCDGNGGYFGL